jgi:hypothetical protein
MKALIRRADDIIGRRGMKGRSVSEKEGKEINILTGNNKRQQ